MGKRVINLTIEPQTGASGAYFASWDFKEPKINATSSTIRVGTKVKLKSGAVYYNGAAVPASVISDEWIVSAVSADRVTLGKNKAKTKTLNSAVNAKYIQSSGTASSALVPIDNIDHYTVQWYYSSGDGVWFDGGSSDVKLKNALYSPPENAKKIRVKVKPVSKTYKQKVTTKKTTTEVTKSYWTGDAEDIDYAITANPKPSAPSSLQATIDQYMITATVTDITDSQTDMIEFVVYKDSAPNKAYKKTYAYVKNARAIASIGPVAAGETYSIKCRAVNIVGSSKTLNFFTLSPLNLGELFNSSEKEYSDWSNFVYDLVSAPHKPPSILEKKALSKNSVYIDWKNVDNATSYTIEYTEREGYFDSSPSNVSSVTIDAVVGHAEITGLTEGTEYFFRIKASNAGGDSNWTKVFSIVLGSKPTAPTTWSNVTTATVKDAVQNEVKLYWMYNSSDNSDQTHAQLRMWFDHTDETVFDIDDNIKKNNANSSITLADLVKKSQSNSKFPYNFGNLFNFKTLALMSKYANGVVVTWQIRTAGITEEFGPWSEKRVVTIHDEPTVNMTTSVNDDGYMTAYPLKISMTTAPDRQTPIGCQISIKSLQSYQTVDSTGMIAYVKKNQVIFSSYKNMKGKNADLPPYSLNAGDVNLDPGKKYELTVTVSMNSGLSAQDSETFTTRWKASNYDPDASIAYNPDTAEVSIVPFCTNENGELINNVTLSVYRREFDGTFTKIATGLKNLYSAGVPDPHPSLDYARYRIVATNTSTGESGYSDVSIPILEKAIIIQWNEEWTFFDATENSEPEQPVWTGSLLRLMYNVNVSDSYNPDVVFKEYVGRAHPVDYYGTQVGETATWSTDIPKDDKETLYALRRLAHWMGHVYVREPSGSGYWASVKVSFNQTHCEVVIPVTLDITRVDGEK